MVKHLEREKDDWENDREEWKAKVRIMEKEK